MFDKELAELDPSSFEFRFKFEDEAGKHDYECGDWENVVHCGRPSPVF